MSREDFDKELEEYIGIQDKKAHWEQLEKRDLEGKQSKKKSDYKGNGDSLGVQLELQKAQIFQALHSLRERGKEVGKAIMDKIIQQFTEGNRPKALKIAQAVNEIDKREQDHKHLSDRLIVEVTKKDPHTKEPTSTLGKALKAPPEKNIYTEVLDAVKKHEKREKTTFKVKWHHYLEVEALNLISKVKQKPSKTGALKKVIRELSRQGYSFIDLKQLKKCKKPEDLDALFEASSSVFKSLIKMCDNQKTFKEMIRCMTSSIEPGGGFMGEIEAAVRGIEASLLLRVFNRRKDGVAKEEQKEELNFEASMHSEESHHIDLLQRTLYTLTIHGGTVGEAVAQQIYRQQTQGDSKKAYSIATAAYSLCFPEPKHLPNRLIEALNQEDCKGRPLSQLGKALDTHRSIPFSFLGKQHILSQRTQGYQEVMDVVTKEQNVKGMKKS